MKVFLQSGADVNTCDVRKETPLHVTAEFGHDDVAKVLLQNGVDVNAVDIGNVSALQNAYENGRVACTLLLLCFGAELKEHVVKFRESSNVNENAIENDRTQILQPINDRLKSLRAGNGMKTSLMSDEERRFMWDLAFFFTIKHRVAAFKAYYAIRSFITFNGIFMGPGYGIGDESVWRREDINIHEGDPDW